MRRPRDDEREEFERREKEGSEDYPNGVYGRTTRFKR